MKLYHGTTARNLKAILGEGIKPRGERRGNWPKVKSREDAVYLTTAYAPYFGMCALAGSDKHAAVVEVDTDRLAPNLLVPDEDALEQVDRVIGFDLAPKEWTIHKRTVLLRETLSAYRGTNYWEISLKALGTCAYLGTIPVEAITRTAIFDTTRARVFAASALDPVIHITNYRLVGRRYRAFTKWLFGDPLDVDAPVRRFADDDPVARHWPENMRFDFALPADEERAGIKVEVHAAPEEITFGR